MAIFSPDTWDNDAPLSERTVREALRSLSDEWNVICGPRWLDPSAKPSDGETDFVLLHPVHGVLVLEVKGGALELRDGTWWTVDSRGRLQSMGRRGPFQQAVTAKHRLRRRLRHSFPRLAERMGHAVCFADGKPDGDLGAEAPQEIVLSSRDFDSFEEALVGAARHHGITNDAVPLGVAEIAGAVAALAPTARVVKDEPRAAALARVQLDEAGASRVELTSLQIDGLAKLRRSRRVVVHGPAGTGKTVLAMRRARELLDGGACVLILSSSAQLIGYLREELQGHRTGRLHVGRTSALLSDETDILQPDAILVDEAQNLSEDEMNRLSRWSANRDVELDLFCDLAQIRDLDRQARWHVPFEHDAHVLVENLRNAPSIIEVLQRLGYQGRGNDGVSRAAPVELIVCLDGAVMRASALQVIYDLLHEDGFSPGQICLVTEAANEMSRLCRSLDLPAATDTWQFGRRRRDRLDIGSFASFQGLERDVVVVMEPTEPTTPPALRRPSGASSLPRSAHSADGLGQDLKTVLTMSLSRARGKGIILGSGRLVTELNLHASNRSIRAKPTGAGGVIEVHGVRAGAPAVARGTRRIEPSEFAD